MACGPTREFIWSAGVISLSEAGRAAPGHTRFHHQVFAEDIAIVEQQFPEDLPIDLHAEAHFPADRSSIAYRKGLAALGLGRNYTA
jgi:phenylpropionate dioxygenase-like ring-hydroxylating dioxygenase large terminal subunit